MKRAFVTRTRAARAWWRLWCCALIVAALPACASVGDLTGPKTVPTVVASVEVSASQPQLSVGSTLALQVVIRDAGGRPVTDRPVLWTTSDAAVATVSAEGLVTAVGVGTVRIAASVEGRSATASLTVTERGVASVVITPASPRVLVGAQLQLASTTLGEGGQVLADRTVVWSSSEPTVAAVDNKGLLTGVASGVATITATSEGHSASVGVTVGLVPVATLAVTPSADTVVVGQTTQLSAVARDSTGAPLSGRTVTWSSGDAAIASVSSAGLVLGVQAGAVTITSTSEGKTATARIVVRARPVGSVIVSPSQVALTVGQSLKLGVLITDDNGTVLSGRPVQFTSAGPAVAQVAADGTVTGVAPGSTTVTVSSEGRSGVVNVVVSASPVATVRVTPEAATVLVGATQRLTAVLLDAAGNVLAPRPVAWLSGAPSVATVASDGTVTGVGPGTATVFASVEGRTTSVAITVRAIPVSSVTVTPPTATLIVGDALDLAAQPRDASGAAISGHVVAWTSSDERIAVVSSSGRVRALAPGQVLITATADGVSGASAITVTGEPVLTVTVDPSSLSLVAGASATLNPTARGRSGVALDGRAFTFTSLDATIATVTAGGVVTAVRTGTTSIVVTSEGRQATVPVTVSSVPVATVAVTLAEPARVVGQSTQATAVTRDASGAPLTGRSVSWSSSNTAVATVTPAGVVNAVGVGSANIIATSEGKTGSATLTVSNVPVASVSVTLAASTQFVGQVTLATATARDAANNALTGRDFVWASSNTAVATVSPTGVVTAIAAGTANITATSEGRTGTASLTVSAVPVASVSVTIDAPARVVGQTARATAVTRDAANNVLSGRAVTWASSDADVATVSATGTITAVGPGQANIIATSEGHTGFATVTVTAAPVASVTVTLGSPSRAVGQTTQATAVLRDAQGNVLTGRPVVWSSSNNAIATVSPSGLVTAVAVGITGVNIIATSEGVSGSAAFTVTLVPVASVSVTAPLTSLAPGQTTQAMAVTRDADDNVLTGRAVTWLSSNPAVATVTTAGSIRAVGPGTSTVGATSEGKTGSIVITVSTIPVATVSVSINNPTLALGQSALAIAVARDADGNVLQGRPTTWTSSAPTVATVSTSGVVTAVGSGTSTITATTEGVAGSVVVTVAPAPVASVSVTLSASTLTVGQTSQASVVTRDASNNVLTGRAVAFSSSNETVATVSATGLVSAVAPGSATITAVSEGQSGSAGITVSVVPVATVGVALESSSISASETTQATATVRDASRNVLVGRPVTWASSNSAVATVDASGLVTGLAAGTTTITATSEGKSGSAVLTVLPAPVASVTVTLSATSLFPLQAALATAVLRDANGTVLTGRAVSWSSSNIAVAAVSTSGVVTGLLPGSADITATSEGVTGHATVTVSLVPVASVSVALASNSVVAGQTTQATATTRDAGGNVLTGRSVTWTSSNSNIATVNASGLVTAVAAGTASIIATSEGESGSATVTITPVPPAPVATVSVTLAASSVTAGATTQATAVTRDANSNVLTGRVVSWSSSNTTVATVNASGLVTARAPGTANIIATSEGKTGSAPLTVSAVPVASVSVTLTPASVTVGQSSQANAVTRDASNNVLTGRAVGWSSSNASVATVNAAGVVTTLAAGSANITATSEGQSGSAILTVTAAPPAPVATVTVTLSANPLPVGGTTLAVAATRDANNNVLTGRVITWTSSNTNVATVNTTGVVVAVAAGSASITATSEGKTGFATLTVTPVPVATVSVSLAANSVTAGQTTQATPVTRDANNNVLTGRAVTWASSNASVATVNAAGLVTTIAAGSATITATSEGQSGSAELTVTAVPPAPVATVAVTLADGSLTVGGSTQATALTRDANNAVLTGRVIAWSSSNTAVATVNAAGVVTAVAAGSANIIATSEGKNGSAPLTVTAVPVATVAVSLASTTLTVGATTQATAVTRDANNSVLTGRAIAWASSNPSVATVDAFGVVTAVGGGTANITATSESKTGSAGVTVTQPPPAPVATVSVTLGASTLVVGQTTQATATLRDANNNVLTGRTIVWSSSNNGVATVNQAGVVTAVAPGIGAVNIIATSEGKTGSAPVAVTLAPVATVTVNLASSSIAVGQTTQATAVLRDANNNVVTGRAVTWSSSNPNVATVNSSGLVTSVGAGSATITATSEGKSGSAPLTVTGPPVSSVSVSLGASTLSVGQTTQATATLRDAQGAVLTGRTVVWSTSDASIATVSSTGVVTATGRGRPAAITATSEGQSGSATVTVR